MNMLKLFKMTTLLLFIVSSCQDKVKTVDTQNFKYIHLVDYPEKDISNAKLLMYEENSNFKKKIKEYDDFSFNVFTIQNSNRKALNIKLNFDNSVKIDYDMELIIDNKYYYKFEDIRVKNDTFKKANAFGNDLHIYKTMEAKVNDSIMIFDQYDSHSEKSIKLPFKLAKGL